MDTTDNTPIEETNIEVQPTQDETVTESSESEATPEPEPTYVTYEQFKAMDIRLGTIRFVEPVEGTDKLLRFLIDFGTEVATDSYEDTDGTTYPVRQIVSGIREYYPEFESLVGKQVLYVINLKPRTIRGVESQGMLMAVGEDDCVFLQADRPVAPGSKVH